MTAVAVDTYAALEAHNGNMLAQEVRIALKVKNGTLARCRSNRLGPIPGGRLGALIAREVSPAVDGALPQLGPSRPFSNQEGPLRRLSSRRILQTPWQEA